MDERPTTAEERWVVSPSSNGEWLVRVGGRIVASCSLEQDARRIAGSDEALALAKRALEAHGHSAETPERTVCDAVLPARKKAECPGCAAITKLEEEEG